MSFRILICFAVFQLLLRSCSTAPTIRSSITLSQILKIAPQSSSCAGAAYPSQCATAAQALQPLAHSFIQYGTTSSGEMAALISLMAYESGDFKYQVNLAGDPGRGTRNMQSGAFNLLYAQSITALAAPLQAITGGKAASALTTSELNSVRGLLIANATYDFGSAAWFLTTQCHADIQTGLKSGSLDGWQAYITGCVGVAASAERQTLWETAVTAFG